MYCVRPSLAHNSDACSSCAAFYVDAGDVSRRSNHVPEHGGHDADTATEISDLHPFCQTGLHKDSPAGRRVNIMQDMKTANRSGAGRHAYGPE